MSNGLIRLDYGKPYKGHQLAVGTCPECQSRDIEYGEVQRDHETYLTINWVCPKCKTEGQEDLHVQFIGHTLVPKK